MNQATQDFICQHQDDDVRQLAFLGSKYPEVDMPFALDQIRGRKMARVKLPRWASLEGIIYPPHISMEQCSSESTALYKAELAARLLGLPASSSGTEMKAENEIEFVDLTGGFGVDFSYIAARLGVKSMYVERQAHLCEAAKENFGRLGLKNAIVKNGDGIEVLHSFLPKKDDAASADDSLGITYDQPRSLLKTNLGLKIIFIDPARRDDAGNKVVSLKDCTPDVTVLQEEMLSKADYVIIKLSPMLDWHRAISELSHVREVHIISVSNECKELLLVLSARNMGENLRIYCINDAQSFVCDELDMESSQVKIAPSTLEEMQYLYEPNASLMKAGCFGVLSGRYDARMLSKKRHLAGITKANIATRNFPLSVAELRKRLKLKDGGETYIFATTLNDESHVLVITEKA